MFKKIAIFGDSIAQGYYDLEKKGWFSHLEKEFMKPHEVYFFNRAVSGHLSEDLKIYLENDCLAIKPDLVFLAIGINDSRYKGNDKSPQVSLDNFEKNLLSFVDFLKKQKVNIIFVGLTSVNEAKTKPISWRDLSYDNKTISQYNKKIKEIATLNKLPFIDLFDLLGNKDFYDGLHPNSQGHEKIFHMVKDYLLNHNFF